MGYRRARAERLEWIRRLLLAGVPEWKIRRSLVEGLNIAAKGDPPRVFKVSMATAKNDFIIIGKEWRQLHDDPEVAERIAGAVLERLTRLALKAEAAGKYSAAIRANVMVMRYLGMRHDRWDRQEAAARLEITGPGGGPIPIAAMSFDMSALSDRELDHVIDADDDAVARLLTVREPESETG